jgi:two-component sensor histidine kinase
LPESANDIIGKTIEEIRFPHELGLDWKDAVQSVFETSRPTKKELSIKVGEDNRHFDCTFTPEEASDGSVATVLAISRDVTELVAVRRSLERALADREVLIRDVHHRVKNNLFLLSSLLYLEREKLTKLLDNPGPAVRSINTIMSRIQVISSIYTYLYESAGEADSICADSFLSGLLELIERAYPERDVDLRLSSEPLRLSVDVAVPLGLVVNEILTNVFKHAFTDTEDGSVSIELMETDGQSAVLTIADNGVGMDTEVQSDGAGIGSELVKALVEQIQGDLRVEASNGTRIRIDFRTILDGSGEEPDGDSSHS